MVKVYLLGLTSVTGPLVAQYSSSDRAANLLAALATEVGLNLPDSCSMSPDMPMDTIRDKATYDHENDKKGENYQANIQTGTKCLVKNTVYQTIICVSGINFGIEVKV